VRAFVLTISHTSRSYRPRADRGMSDPAELPNTSWRAQVQPGFGQKGAGSVSGRRGEKCLGWSGSACSRLTLLIQKGSRPSVFTGMCTRRSHRSRSVTQGASG
jgi:hypothetical protein